jgi:hypothetical protein
MSKHAAGFRPASLDAVNFLLADVRGALGPYLNVFLVTQQHWSQSAVGLVTAIGGLLGLAVQTPIGAAIDATRAKRALIVAALGVLAARAVTIYVAPYFWHVLVANSLMAMVGDVFGPAVAALTLGLYRRAELARRMGRNSAFDHAGNVAIAAVAGAVGWALSQRAVFLLVPVFASRRRARHPGGSDRPSAGEGRGTQGEREGWRSRAVGPVGIVHVPSPARLRRLRHAVPLRERAAVAAGRAEARAGARGVGNGNDVVLHHCGADHHAADRSPRRAQRRQLGAQAAVADRVRHPAGTHPLYTLSDSSSWLIGVQLLDGVGAGIFGAITPLVLADLMRGTGRYNIAQGVVATVQGIGASSSGLVAGLIVDNFGYTAAFFEAAVVAAIALAVLVILMPETALPEPGTPSTEDLTCRELAHERSG